jgi:pimeloyl-ACP methyl ester carboxylesterase
VLAVAAVAGAACTTTERVAPLPTPPTTVVVAALPPPPATTRSATTVADAPTMSTAMLAAPAAIVWGDGPVGVVLVHGAAFDAVSWAPQAEQIAAAGATVLAIAELSVAALVAAADQLRASGATSVTLIGASAGGDTVLRTAAGHPGVADQLIVLSANKVVDGLGAEPKLFIASIDDPGAGVSQQIADVSAGDRNEVVLVPGAAHSQHLFDSPQSDDVLDLILDRLPPV